MGVSLLDAYRFDIRENLIVERQRSKFIDGNYVVGTGPSQREAGERKLKQKIEVANQFGRDVVYFGLGKEKTNMLGK